MAEDGATLRDLQRLSDELFAQCFPQAGDSQVVGSESLVIQEIEAGHAELGYRLFRNNSGAFKDATGRLVRFGLGNRSARSCKRMKSSDFIGFRIVDGKPIFASIECKKKGWTKPINEHERAQARWLHAVNLAGGIGRFVTCLEDLR